jgi:glutamine---fructose-6-phosphate transaminase (isomerizing)
MLSDSHLYREIYQQPDVLRRFLAEAGAPVRALAAAVQERNIGFVLIAARGTSDNAGRYAKYLLGARNGLPVALAAPSLFTVYQQPPRLAHTLVLGISQSGRSPDLVAVLHEARRQGALTAAFTNAPESELAQEVEHVVPLAAGVEQSVAATKSYTAELAAVALLSAHLGVDESAFSVLQNIPDAVAATLQMEPAITAVAPRYRYMERCVVIGRGYNYATAFELALKLKELTYTVVEPYSSADFLHGPLALLETGFPVILIAPQGAMTPQLREFAATVRGRGAELIAISDDEKILAQARIPLALPQPVPEWLSPLTAIVPAQLFAMHLAATRDYDVDAPRAIQKVTETA